MKKLSSLFVISLLFLTYLSQISAQSTNSGEPYRWEKVWSDSTVRVMLNRGTIERSGKDVRVFVAIMREHPTPEGSRYTLARLEVDCSARHYKALREFNSSEIGLQGKDLGDLGVFAKDRSPMAANEYLKSGSFDICRGG